jgi:hypothetical protein
MLPDEYASQPTRSSAHRTEATQVSSSTPAQHLRPAWSRLDDQCLTQDSRAQPSSATFSTVHCLNRSDLHTNQSSCLHCSNRQSSCLSYAGQSSIRPLIARLLAHVLRGDVRSSRFPLLLHQCQKTVDQFSDVPKLSALYNG